jgi:hypothetical protein
MDGRVQKRTPDSKLISRRDRHTRGAPTRLRRVQATPLRGHLPIAGYCHSTAPVAASVSALLESQSASSLRCPLAAQLAFFLPPYNRRRRSSEGRLRMLGISCNWQLTRSGRESSHCSLVAFSTLGRRQNQADWHVGASRSTEGHSPRLLYCKAVRPRRRRPRGVVAGWCPAVRHEPRRTQVQTMVWTRGQAATPTGSTADQGGVASGLQHEAPVNNRSVHLRSVAWRGAEGVANVP